MQPTILALCTHEDIDVLLSMWNIYNELGYDNMVPMIQDGSPTAHDVRLIASSYLDDSKIYVAPASEYFESGDDDTIIVHRRNMILIRDTDVPNVFDELCAVIERFDAWELHLAEMSAHAAALQEMVDESDEFFRAPLFIYAPDGHALALSSGYGPDTHPHWAGLVRDGGLTEEGLQFLKEAIDLPTVFLDRRPTRRSSAEIMPGANDYIHCSLFPHGHMAAHLVCFGFEDKLPTGTEHLVGVLGKYATAHMEAYFSVYNPLSKLATAFRDALTGGPYHEDEVRGLTRAIRWKPEGPFRISCIGEKEPGEEQRQVLLPNLAKGLSAQVPEAVLVMLDNVLVVVESGRFELDAVDLRGNYVIGRSVAFHELSDCRAYYLQAEHELERSRSARVCCSDAAEHRTEELGVFLAERTDVEFAATYLPAAIRVLLTYDRQNDSSYYDTLRAYCLAGFHAGLAAQLLGIHRNSFSYRLERIREIADMSELDTIVAKPSLEGMCYLRNAMTVADALCMLEKDTPPV